MKNEEILQLERLVYQMAHKFKNLRSVVMDYEDTVQEVWLAIVKASKKFDESRGIKFITYAYLAVENRLKTLWSRRLEEFEYLDDVVSQKDEDGNERGYEELVGIEGEQEGVVFLKELLEKLSTRAKLVVYEMLMSGESDVKKLERKLGISLKEVLEEMRIALQG